MNIRKILFGLIIIWILVVFLFSIQPAIESDKVSNHVGAVILEHASEDLQEDSHTWSYLEWISFHRVIRKFGHFGEFFILGVLMILNMRQTQMIHKKSISFLCCATVASIDETIQLFVPGRSGQVSDVLLDCCGSFVGMCFCIFVMSLILRKRENHGH